MKAPLLFSFLLFLSAFGQGQNLSIVDSLIAIPYDEMVSDLNHSKQVLESGLAHAVKLDYTSGQAELNDKLGTVMYLLGERDISLKHTLKAINLFEQLGKPVRVGSINCSIGYQMKSRDMVKANSFMQKGISILIEHNDSSALEAAFNNYGVLKEMEGQLDSAEYYYKKSLKLVSLANDSIGIPYGLNHLAGIALLKKNFEEAKSLLNQAYAIRKLRRNEYGILENTILYGDFHSAKGNSDSATFYFKKAIDMSYEVGYPYMRQYCFQQLAEVYESTKNTTEALAAQKSYSAIKDSLITEKRTAQLAEMEVRFETAEKEKENLLLKQETQQQQLVVSQQRVWIFSILGVGLSLLFLGLFLYQRNKQKESEKRDAAIIAEREKGLQSIIQATEEERKRIAKDLHDGIVQSLTGLSLKIQKQAISVKAKNSGLDQELTSTRGTLDDAIAEVRGISHQMMPRVLNEMGLIPALDDMLAKSLGMTDINYEFEHHNIEDQRFKETLEISLYRITQELVNNIIKHSEAQAVSVQLLKTKSHLVLVVEDNGKGFEFGDPNTQNGIGLMNISSRTKAIHGEVNYEPSPQQGTVATIRVPLD